MNPKRILDLISSVRITVVCLAWLFVLTLWGTVAQIHNGLWASQERFFNSFVFFVFKVLPLPGAQLTLWVLFINLVCVTRTRFIKYRNWRYAGILIIHFGLLLYFAAAYVAFHSKESNVHFVEGEGTNVSKSYNEWEISVWRNQGSPRKVNAVNVSNAKDQDRFTVGDVSFTIVQFYANCSAFTGTKSIADTMPINAAGITTLKPKDKSIEREKNIAGAILRVDGLEKDVLLYGLESQPTAIQVGGKTYYVILRNKRFQLPFTIVLKDFKAEFYPGTNMAKSYESLVTINDGKSKRDVRIYMNNPLRYKDWTLYQASYDVDDQGLEYSTLAAVQNGGAFLPYIACLIVFLGLAWHFAYMALEAKLKKSV